ITEKLQEFFRDCDKEGKGFITRNDMQELEGNFPLSAEELMLVFDKLDTDKNGCLTQEEFTAAIKTLGFEECLPAQTTAKEQGEKRNTSEKLYESHGFVPLEEADEEEKQYFMSLMDNLGADNIFEDQSEIWKLWNQLRQDEPHLLGNLEEFLAKVTSEIRQAKKEKEKLEMTLKKRIVEHNKEVQQLYEEMEQQITKEKERLHSENYMTRKVLSKELKKELDIKKDEVQHLIGVQTELETQLSTMHSEQQETSTENQKLKRTNQELESQLEKIREQLQEAQVRLQVMRETTTQNKEDENKLEIYLFTQALQSRFKYLMKRVQEEKEKEKHTTEGLDERVQEDKEKEKHTTEGLGEETLKEGTKEDHGVFQREVSEYKENETKTIGVEEGSSNQYTNENSGIPPKETPEHEPNKVQVTEVEEPLRSLRENHGIFHQEVPKYKEEKTHTLEEEQNQEKLQEQGNKISDRTDETASLMKDTKETPQLSHDQEELPHNPDHIFNVMFVGNSDVGKTSFIRRFHQNQFFSGLGATVGVDFQVKTLTVDDKCFALRLWDTAGQERTRFHSVTRQFFRKADGVVIMYDITSEQSFIAVRFWLDCIQEEVGDGVALLLLGNKADCAADRKISTETGQQLAKEYSLLFYECSAASEFNITEPMVHLIRLLREQEKKIKEKVLELASQPQKARGCCA
uniref:RAB44, member RAS onco family n=1 Tax=Latimeria chalumnae TaxID=7897 RepID=H3AKS4_LATCH